jgi:hypothetical protein
MWSLDVMMMKLMDLDIVTSKRSARSRPSCVVTFDPHLWLDPFAELWNLPAARTQTRLNASAPCPASQHVLDRERQGSAADAAIGAALARLSRQHLRRLQASTGASQLHRSVTYPLLPHPATSPTKYTPRSRAENLGTASARMLQNDLKLVTRGS